jgi:uridylate kinase
MTQVKNTPIVIHLGGSIIVAGEIQSSFLKEFRDFLLPFLKEGKRVALVVGGGTICRDYQNAAASVIDISDEDKDWLGIHATRLNAHLLRAIFFDVAHPVVLDDPMKKIKNEDAYNLFIASGWRPGWSTDYVAVMIAKRYGAKQVIIATKVPYVYEEDVEKNGNAAPLTRLSWADYRKMISDVWVPGLRAPVDPIAAKLAQELGLEAVVIQGTNLENFENVLHDKEFIGTLIK